MNPGDIGDGPIFDTAPNLLVVEDKPVELNVTGVVHVDVEFAGL